MARLSKNELTQHRAWLTSWRMPDEMIAYVDQIVDHMGSVDFFAQAGVTFLRDAWAAGHFGRARNATAVCLMADEWPDFQLSFDDAVEPFEFVEADLQGRRRTDEYKAAAPQIEAKGFSSLEDDPVEDWIARAEQAGPVLAAAIRKKLSKHYVQGAGLLILLNINEYGIRQREIEATFPEVAVLATSAFTKVWIMWKMRVYGPWP